MKTFVVVAMSHAQALKTRLEEIFPDSHVALSSTVFLVATHSGTAKSVSDLIGITQDDGDKRLYGSAVVLSFSDYWGIAPSNIWAWIADKKEAS